MSETKSLTHHPKVEKQLNRLDKKLNLLFEELKHYSDDQLNRKPAADKWSVIQVLHHCSLVENASQKYVQKKLSFNPQLKNKNLITWFRKQILALSLISPFKFKAPEGVGDNLLPENAGFWDTAKQWKEQRIQLKAYMASLSSDLYNKEVYKHPASGRIDLMSMLDFFEMHFDRHLKQIRKLTKKYPKQN